MLVRGEQLLPILSNLPNECYLLVLVDDRMIDGIPTVDAGGC